MSRLNVTPNLVTACALTGLACLVVWPATAWSQADTPLRTLERQLGISYDGVTPVMAEQSLAQPASSSAQVPAPASEPDNTSPDSEQQAVQDDAQAATQAATQPAAQNTPTPQTKQQAKLAAMRALVNPGEAPVPAVNTEPDGNSAGGDSDFERQLAAIRQALVDEALKGPTRVVSTAWVDQNGQLHEDTQVTNGMQVRGVRVLNYTQDGQNNIVARIATDQQTPDTHTPNGDKTNACAAPPDMRWTQHISFVSALGAGIRGEDMHFANQLMQAWRTQWEQQVNTSAVRWRQSTYTPAQQDAYQTALVGGLDAQAGDWQLKLHLNNAPPEVVPAAPTTLLTLVTKQPEPPAKTTNWQVDMELSRTDLNQVVWRDSQQLSWTLETITLVPPDVPLALMARIRQASATGVETINALMACEPVQFSVLSKDGTSLVVSGGANNGLRHGDKLVLVDSKELPKRVLHAGVAQRLAMGEVVQVGMAQSTVRQVAGPAIPSPLSGAWVAMPY